MSAFAEHVDWLVRAGPEAHRYGDKYERCVAVRELDRWTCELVGYTFTGMPLSQFRDILECIAHLPGTEYRTAIIRRIRAGRERRNEYDLTRFKP